MHSGTRCVLSAALSPAFSQKGEEREGRALPVMPDGRRHPPQDPSTKRGGLWCGVWWAPFEASSSLPQPQRRTFSCFPPLSALSSSLPSSALSLARMSLPLLTAALGGCARLATRCAWAPAARARLPRPRWPRFARAARFAPPFPAVHSAECRLMRLPPLRRPCPLSLAPSPRARACTGAARATG